MSTNKHAVIRYQALNKCFSNRGRKFFMEDLIVYVSSALQEYTGTISTISRRQIFNDINFMRSESGFQAPIVAIKEGKRVYYRYEDPDYIMSVNSLNAIEAELIKTAMDILGRFKGLPMFDYIEELSLKLQKSFELQDLDHIIFFDQNEYLKNINHLGHLLKAIQDKDVLEITYQSFNQQNQEVFILHPYFLKQYNKRWFLFGQHPDYSDWTNLAIDRIVSFTKSYKHNYINILSDPEEYFEDIIGVSKPVDQKPQLIYIKIDKSLWSYIETKPLHHSQKVIERSTESITIQLDIIPNYEFYSQILGFGPYIEIIEPIEVRNVVREKILANLKSYS